MLDLISPCSVLRVCYGKPERDRKKRRLGDVDDAHGASARGGGRNGAVLLRVKSRHRHEDVTSQRWGGHVGTAVTSQQFGMQRSRHRDDEVTSHRGHVTVM
eukprot:2251471-Rhodomonas_salina.3